MSLEPGWWEAGGGGRPDAAAQTFQAGKWVLREGVPFPRPLGFSGPGRGVDRAKPEELEPGGGQLWFSVCPNPAF